MQINIGEGKMNFLVKKNNIERVLIMMICIGLYIISDSKENSVYYNAFRIFMALILMGLIFSGKQILLREVVIWKFIFLIFALLSFLWSKQAEKVDTFKTVFFNFIIFTLFIFYCNSIKRFENLIIGWAIAGFFLMGYCMKSINIMELSTRTNIEGMNLNMIGVKLSFSCLSLLYLYLNQHKMYYFLEAMILAVFSLFTGSKGVILRFIVICFMYAVYCQKGIKKILYVGLAIGIILIGYYFILNNTYFYNIIGKRTQEFVQGIMPGSNSFNQSDSIRIGLIKEGWDLFKKNWLRGIGLANFQLINSYKLYAHNNYIELLCNLGIIGTVIYYFPYIKNLILMLNEKKTTPLILFGITDILVCLVGDISGVSYYELFMQLEFFMASSALLMIRQYNYSTVFCVRNKIDIFYNNIFSNCKL